MSSPQPLDLMLVVGTSATVWPAAGYIQAARSRGARVAVVNMDEGVRRVSGLVEGDWFFKGDAAAVLPVLLGDVVGEI